MNQNSKESLQNRFLLSLQRSSFLQLVSFFLAVVSRSLEVLELLRFGIALVVDLWSSDLHCSVALAHYLLCCRCCFGSILSAIFHVSAPLVWFAHFLSSYALILRV
ncbi:unnamed protein product [Lathyrus oleraceus]